MNSESRITHEERKTRKVGITVLAMVDNPAKCVLIEQQDSDWGLL